MNITYGLCADLIHFHSSVTVGTGWVPAPKSIVVSASKNVFSRNNWVAEQVCRKCDDVQYMACRGAYTHRMCTFTRPPLETATSSQGEECGGMGKDCPSLCEVNSVEILKDLGMPDIVKTVNECG